MRSSTTPPSAAQHSVYCALPGPIRPQIVGQRGVDELRRARAHHQRLAEVTDVEQADRLAGGGVLADGAGVGHRHQPAAERRERGAQRAVLLSRGPCNRSVSVTANNQLIRHRIVRVDRREHRTRIPAPAVTVATSPCPSEAWAGGADRSRRDRRVPAPTATARRRWSADRSSTPRPSARSRSACARWAPRAAPSRSPGCTCRRCRWAACWPSDWAPRATSGRPRRSAAPPVWRPARCRVSRPSSPR